MLENLLRAQWQGRSNGDRARTTNEQTTKQCVLLDTQLLNLFLQRSDLDFETSFFFLGLVQSVPCLVKLCLVHRLDLSRFFAPFCLQLVQIVRQLSVLSFQRSYL